MSKMLEIAKDPGGAAYIKFLTDTTTSRLRAEAAYIALNEALDAEIMGRGLPSPMSPEERRRLLHSFSPSLAQEYVELLRWLHVRCAYQDKCDGIDGWIRRVQELIGSIYSGNKEHVQDILGRAGYG